MFTRARVNHERVPTLWRWRLDRSAGKIIRAGGGCRQNLYASPLADQEAGTTRTSVCANDVT